MALVTVAWIEHSISVSYAEVDFAVAAAGAVDDFGGGGTVPLSVCC